MGDYFECEVRLDDKNETFITKVNLRVLPRIGEHLQTVLEHDKKPHNFIIKDIWHFAGDIMTGHRIIIFVNHD